MVYSALSDSTTISQFTRRKSVTISTTGSDVPALYQVKCTIAYEPGMNADFSDIRFNTKSNEYLDYWIESKVDSDTAEVWVELIYGITNTFSDTIWMYYGNDGLSDGGVGADTFIQWHGSATSSFLDALIIPYTGYIFEGKCRSTGSTHNLQWGVSTFQGATDDNTGIQSYSNSNLRYIYAKNAGVQTVHSEPPKFVTNIWYKLKIINSGSIVQAYVDDNQIGSDISTNLPNDNMGLWSILPTNGEQEWSFARKYIADEPIPTYGTAQHQRRVPQFM